MCRIFSVILLLSCGALLAGASIAPPAPVTQLSTANPRHKERVEATAKALGLVLDYDTPPKPTKVRPPKYPEKTPGRYRQGTVLVMFVINSAGDVTEAEVLESIPGLDAAALKAVRSWRFKPAVKDGRPVGTVALSPVTFRVH